MVGLALTAKEVGVEKILLTVEIGYEEDVMFQNNQPVIKVLPGSAITAVPINNDGYRGAEQRADDAGYEVAYHGFLYAVIFTLSFIVLRLRRKNRLLKRDNEGLEFVVARPPPHFNVRYDHEKRDWVPLSET